MYIEIVKHSHNINFKLQLHWKSLSKIKMHIVTCMLSLMEIQSYHTHYNMLVSNNKLANSWLLFHKFTCRILHIMLALYQLSTPNMGSIILILNVGSESITHKTRRFFKTKKLHDKRNLLTTCCLWRISLKDGLWSGVLFHQHLAVTPILALSWSFFCNTVNHFSTN